MVKLEYPGKLIQLRDRLKVLGFQWESESKEWYYLDPLGKKALAFNHPLPVSFAMMLMYTLLHP